MLSSRLDVNLRRTARRFLIHTYTWVDNDKIPVLDAGQPTYDMEGNQVFSDADPITEKPCLFLFEDIISNNASGPVTLRIPTLYVLSDDQIAEKDVVLNVLSRDGTILLESALVDIIDSTAEANNAVMKVLRLSGANTV